MRLEALEISVEPSYSDNAGKYKGRVKFSNKGGDITLNLNETLSNRILEVVAEELVLTAKEVATNLTANCIDSVKQLESK